MEADTIIVGAGVLGAAAAYHLQRMDPQRSILLLEKEKRAGAGNTGKSAALYRNIFSSKTSKLLSASSIRYYLELGQKVQMNPIGYLWMFSKKQWEASSSALKGLDPVKDELELIDHEKISSMLNINREGKDTFPSVDHGIWGHLCGSLSGMGLAQHYTEEFEKLGGEIQTSTTISKLNLKGSKSRFSPWDEVGLDSVEDLDGNIFKARDFIFAVGAWSQELLGRYGIFTGTLPKKRQLFGIKVDDPYQVAGDIDLEEVPAMILPAGGTYVKPILHRRMMILGLADDLGQPYDMNDPGPDEEYFERGIVPVLDHYFPELKDWELKMKWAGYYSYHWPDKNPVVESVKNITWAAGTSGSGIMKADAIGRVAASRVLGRNVIELFDGSKILTDSVSLKNRDVDNEKFVI
jgi:glycine/D-amino acid oxidase-like deaminating enzyme